MKPSLAPTLLALVLATGAFGIACARAPTPDDEPVTSTQ
jgi:hypothetical protein